MQSALTTGATGGTGTASDPTIEKKDDSPRVTGLTGDGSTVDTSGSSTTVDESSGGPTGSTSSTSSSSGIDAFRQKAADAGLHDEGFAGANQTQDNDQDAVVDEGSEVKEIAATTTQSTQEVVETYDDVQPGQNSGQNQGQNQGRVEDAGSAASDSLPTGKLALGAVAVGALAVAAGGGR